MHPTRRQVLEASIGVAGAATLTSLLRAAKASSSEPTDPHRRFVFAYFLGGWDAIHCIDPKDPSVYDDSTATVQSMGVEIGHRQLGLTPDQAYRETDVEGLFLGHFVGDEMRELASQMAVIRGMTVSSVDHGAGSVHAMTGRAPAGTNPRGSSLCTIFAAALGEEDLIPNLVSGIRAFNLDHPKYASGMGASSYSDLMNILGPGLTSLEPAERGALETFFAKEKERLENPRMGDILSIRRSSRTLVDEEIGEFFNPENALNSDVVADYTNNAGGLMSNAFVAHQAITQGISRCVTIRATPNLDQHFGSGWTTTHGPFMQGGFNTVSRLAKVLAQTEHEPTGDSWLDHTTIVCASEFNRSPALNSSGGRDHATNNCMLLLGGGIRHGAVIGESHPIRMAAQRIDPITGLVDAENGMSLEHENVARTLLASIGITEDIADLRAEAIPALLA